MPEPCQSDCSKVRKRRIEICLDLDSLCRTGKNWEKELTHNRGLDNSKTQIDGGFRESSVHYK